MANKANRKSASSGVATVSVPATPGHVLVTIEPGSPTPSGTGTLTGKTWDADGYEAIHDSDGNAITDIDLSARVSYSIQGVFKSIKVASDSGSDAFDVIVKPYRA